MRLNPVPKVPDNRKIAHDGTLRLHEVIYDYQQQKQHKSDGDRRPHRWKPLFK